jgi:hypothetical protein
MSVYSLPVWDGKGGREGGYCLFLKWLYLRRIAIAKNAIRERQ